MSARLVYWQTMAIWGVIVTMLGDSAWIRILGAVMSLIALLFLGSFESDERKREDRR